MMFYESFFGVTPKSLDSVDINFSGGEFSFMIDSQMPIATEHQRIIASKFIRINNGPSSYGLNGQGKQSFGTDIFNHFNFDNPIPFQNTKYGDFIKCASASFPFPSATKVSLIQFNLAVEKLLAPLSISHNRYSDQINRSQHRRIAKAKLLGDFSCRKLQLKELNDPKPLFMTDSEFVEPPSGKIMEGITTAFTSESFTNDSINFIAPASNAETTVVFPT